MGINRCGKDGELCYPGATGVFAPDGENRVMAGDKPRRIDCMLDLAAVHRARSQLPALEQSSLASSLASAAINTLN
ncbi:MAG: hypothetical protein D6820_08795 [Lentisphaerae bacterium]|nr:MAG: hypothetical protein D6820_08795 [Lentisphaerota bacterium]